MTRPASLEADEPRIRLFCALPVPDDAADALRAWQREQIEDVPEARRLDHFHVTLAFLGHRPGSEVDGIAEALRAAAGAARRPTLVARRYRETRSVGMLVFDDRESRATALALELHERLERLGVYKPERRPWLPHVTVLRFRRAPRLHPKAPELEISPSGAALYHSVLRSGGAQYDIIESVALGG